MDADAKIVCNILSILVVLGAILFNALGIYILKAARVGKSNQINIVISLSVADILNSLGFLGQMSVDLSGHDALDSKTGLVIWMIRAVIYHPWYAMFYLLTLDRFLACNFPFKYRAMSGRNTMRNILIAFWTLGLIPAPIYCFLDMEKIRVFYDQFVWVAFDTIFVFLFILTYGSIYYRKKRSKFQFRHKDTNDDNHRFFVVTTVILVGFVFFAIIPDLTMSILHSYDEQRSVLAQPAFELWWNINMLIDPLIYVFLQPKFRKTAIMKIQGVCAQRRRNRSFGTETGSGTGTTSDGMNKDVTAGTPYVAVDWCINPKGFDNMLTTVS